MAAADFSAIAAATTIAIASCTSIHLGPGTLAGTNWRVTAINDRATPGGPDYHMLFEQPHWRGGFGCNGMMAEYRLQDGQLTLGRSEGARFYLGRIMATERDCSDQPTGHFEIDATAILMQPMAVRFRDGRHLTLSNAAGSIELDRAR